MVARLTLCRALYGSYLLLTVTTCGGGGSNASSSSNSTGASSGAGAGGVAGNAGGAGSGAAGAAAGGGAAGTAGAAGSGSCTFTVTSQTADKAGAGGIPTVGIVNWSVDLSGLTSASIVFGLNGGTTSMTAPVALTQGPNFRTLLLGMKGSKTYDFHIEVKSGSTSCTSPQYSIQTGAVSSSIPRITHTAGTSSSPSAKGFIVTSSGIGAGMAGGTAASAYAFIFDADGDPVWYASAPPQCSRALMSYDGEYMWMASLNVTNQTAQGGQVDRISMDGLTRTTKIPGLSNCHHDLTALPDGRVACLSWIQQKGDQPSDLIESDYQGNLTTIKRLDASVYLGGTGAMGATSTFHANSLHYHAKDDSYTIGDRNPNLFIKLSHAGAVLWQLGGSCNSAPAPACVAGTWRVNHGHDMLDDGTFLIFNNGQSGASSVFQYNVNETGTFTATQAWAYSPGTTSNVLGDVQRLPNGNTLVTFSTAGIVHEIDASRQLIQSFSVSGLGYSEWRETLYGPPPRF